MKLVFIRHGETKAKKMKISEGHLPGELSENGIEQAKEAGRGFYKARFDFILSSDLKRCMDTMNYVLAEMLQPFIKPEKVNL